ncbi:MAG: phenylalanine--tRNA ligase subunit alpha [Planctomycetes bacterium]|nr:phenylalanine--tRNA ligase subunit alpha [Planctomycetota bacterium]
MSLIDDLNALRTEAEAAVSAAADAAACESLRARYVGRKGRIRDLTARLGELSGAEKGTAGKLANDVKNAVESLCDARVSALGGTKPAVAPAGPRFDVTLPGTRFPVGRRHPVYETLAEIVQTFARMGFAAVTGPEIETSYHNFEALNIPADHPSRDGFDTFYLGGSTWLLRSHTSPVQVRTMKSLPPPVRVVVPGKVFRPDTADASHSPMFHQVEGLMVDEGVSFADLKGVLTVFARQFFGPETRTRFRPSFFPFTEPSAEVDVSCIFCGGKGCSVCGQGGWIEILGSGMVHPRVFEKVGYDAERYTGFAFGMGVERIAMLRHRIPDIRLLTENNVRFLGQF